MNMLTQPSNPDAELRSLRDMFPPYVIAYVPADDLPWSVYHISESEQQRRKFERALDLYRWLRADATNRETEARSRAGTGTVSQQQGSSSWPCSWPSSGCSLWECG
jgi:hypothetical protein